MATHLLTYFSSSRRKASSCASGSCSTMWSSPLYSHRRADEACVERRNLKEHSITKAFRIIFSHRLDSITTAPDNHLCAVDLYERNPAIFIIPLRIYERH